MDVRLIAPLAAALLLAACGSDNSDTATSEAPASERQDPVAEGSSERMQPVSKLDPDTPASEFVAIENATACLGVAWGLADESGKQLARDQLALVIDGNRFQKITDPFAKNDALKEIEPEAVRLAEPFAGKRFITYTTKPREDSFREYNFDKQGFFDSSGLTWNSNMVYTEGTGRGGRCVFSIKNREEWANQFTVKDEAQARAASAGLAAKTAVVRFYMHVDSVVASDSIAEWPQLNTTLLRAEILDTNDTLLARAYPMISSADAQKLKEAKEEACAYDPVSCM